MVAPLHGIKSRYNCWIRAMTIHHRYNSYIDYLFWLYVVQVGGGVAVGKWQRAALLAGWSSVWSWSMSFHLVGPIRTPNASMKTYWPITTVWSAPLAITRTGSPLNWASSSLSSLMWYLFFPLFCLFYFFFFIIFFYYYYFFKRKLFWNSQVS